MKRTIRIYKASLILLLLIMFAHTNQAQELISLEEAIEIALVNYIAVDRDELLINKYELLAEAGKPQEATQLYLSGEEFNFRSQRGIHSINVQQNFNLPNVSNAYKNYYGKNAELGKAKLELTKLELIREVKLAYYELVYAKENQKLQNASFKIYEDFLSLTTQRFNSGETGILPQMASKTELTKANLERNRANERYVIALSLFNSWLQDDTNYDAIGKLDHSHVSQKLEHPETAHLLFFESKKDLAMSSIAMKETQFSPQLNTGFKLQTIRDFFPLFGYQIGVNMPLFRGAMKKQVEASRLEVEIIEADKQLQSQKINRNLTELEYQIEHQQRIIESIREDLLPIVNEQVALTHKAFLAGETSYLNYVDGLKEVKAANKELLNEMYTLKLLVTEREYWTGH